ncbi:phosphopantetheine-binding protein, partial [Streptomyces sp. NPDC127574]|uniref:phosphopantetheine-binding protein n=1 Tax=Streptomyces sp. NPDC127574 TaxID=3345401 RepID=UPI003637D656
ANEREETLVRLFDDLLGREQIGVDDDFFACGGHSLLATRLSGRIRKEFAIDSKVTMVFRNPTVAQLAARIEELTAPDQSRPRRANRPQLRQMTVQE